MQVGASCTIKSGTICTLKAEVCKKGSQTQLLAAEQLRDEGGCDEKCPRVVGLEEDDKSAMTSTGEEGSRRRNYLMLKNFLVFRLLH